MRITRKYPTVEARQVTEENQEALATWCHGSVRGTRLPADERIVQIQGDRGEDEADVGDWIVQEGPEVFRIYTDVIFGLLFNPPEAPPYESGDVLIFLGNQTKSSFRCEACGSNVFRWIDKGHTKARCNGCRATYTAEGAKA